MLYLEILDLDIWWYLDIWLNHKWVLRFPNCPSTVWNSEAHAILKCDPASCPFMENNGWAWLTPCSSMFLLIVGYVSKNADLKVIHLLTQLRGCIPVDWYKDIKTPLLVGRCVLLLLLGHVWETEGKTSSSSPPAEGWRLSNMWSWPIAISTCHTYK